jgi:hypothetical protein
VAIETPPTAIQRSALISDWPCWHRQVRPVRTHPSLLHSPSSRPPFCSEPRKSGRVQQG